MYLRILSCFSLLLLATTALADTSREEEFTCPLCQEVFSARVDLSGSTFDRRLDLKPLGAIVAPWRLPVCPKCHFVLIDGIEETDYTRCREVVASDIYLSSVERGSYYLAGLLLEALNTSPLSLAHVFLKTSWQEESNEAWLREDLERSLKHLDEDILGAIRGTDDPDDSDDDPTLLNSLLLKGELLRRLGRFEDATQHFGALREWGGLKDTFFGNIVRFQLQRCSERDANTHTFSEVKKSAEAETSKEETQQKPDGDEEPRTGAPAPWEAAACADWARTFAKGLLGDKDMGLARQWAERACELENALGCRLAGEYLDDDGLPQEERAKARAHFEKACDLGSGRGCGQLALLWSLAEDGGPQDKPKARSLYERGCDLGHGLSCRNLGVVRRKGLGGAKDQEGARVAFQAGCDRGNLDSCAILGDLLAQGKGGGVDKSGAREKYESACELKHGLSCLRAAQFWHDGTAGTIDFQRRNEFLTSGCDYGSLPACGWLGWLLWREGTEKSDAESRDRALSLLGKACKKGYARSCNNLGWASFESGDDTEAERLFNLACEKGESQEGGEACYNLGTLRLYVDADPVKARDAYRQACEKTTLKGCLEVAALDHARGIEDEKIPLDQTIVDVLQHCEEHRRSEDCLALGNWYRVSGDAESATRLEALGCQIMVEECERGNRGLCREREHRCSRGAGASRTIQEDDVGSVKSPEADREPGQ